MQIFMIKSQSDRPNFGALWRKPYLVIFYLFFFLFFFYFFFFFFFFFFFVEIFVSTIFLFLTVSTFLY